MSRSFKSSPLAQIVPSFGAIFLCVVATYWLGLDNDRRLSVFGYFMVASVGVIVLQLSISLVSPTILTLSDDGFTWRSWRYRTSFRWADIESFTVGPSVGPLTKPKIAFSFRPEHTPDQRVATLVNRSVNGYDRSMSNVWNVHSDELVGTLNGYVERANGRLE